MIVIIKHIDIEGPGTLGDFLNAKNIPFKIIELGAGDALPTSLEGIDAVVVLGGPMNVDEEAKYSFLKAELAFIQKVLAQETPFLGICLGSQLLAKAAGALVVKSPVKEIGWYHVEITPDGKNDPFFKGFKADEKIYHWHGDMFQIPQKGTLLATAKGCPHQALKVGRNAYGVQFHVEVTDKSIKEWCDEYIDPASAELLSCSATADGGSRLDHAASMLNDYYTYADAFNAQANNLYQNFIEIVEHAKSSARAN